MKSHRRRKTVPKWSIALVVWLMFVVVGCGSGSLTLAEYAEEVEELTTTMYGTIDELVADFEAAPEEDRDLAALYTAIGVAFQGLRDGLDSLEPPDETAELHAVSVDTMTRLTEAQDAFVQRIVDTDPGDDVNLEETPEALALLAVQEEMTAFCQERQAELDATADREALADIPWIPNEMKEVVDVLFGCGTEEGSGS